MKLLYLQNLTSQLLNWTCEISYLSNASAAPNAVIEDKRAEITRVTAD